MHHRSALIVLVTLALLGLRSSPDTARTNVFLDVPMRVHRGLPVVDVWIDGHGPFRFGLDTGAMDSVVIGPILARRLGDTASVGRGERKSVAIDSMRIGGATFSDIAAVSVDFGSVQVPWEGTLGLPLFTDFLTTIDYRRNRLRVEHAELPEANGKTILPIEQHPTGLPFLQLDVDGHVVSALVDTGNLAAAFYLPRSLVTQLRWASSSSTTRRARTLGADIPLEEVTLAGTIHVGQYSIDKPVVVFGDTLGTAIVGGLAFREHVVTIDQKNSRLGLSR